MRAIVNELKVPTARGALRKHDMVALQEMWSPTTYELYREELHVIYPYSHYWRSGPLGSGLALFSVHPIEEVTYMSYALNGHPGKIFDGDWFANKGVGHVRLRLTHIGTTMDVFTTHLIADYTASTGYDRYGVQRMTQLYELLRFARSYRDPKGAGALILGDLNMEPGTWAWQALVPNQETFISVYEGLTAEQRPCTCNCPLNAYRKARERPTTIDHILYTPKGMILLNTVLAFTGELSSGGNQGYKSYSDHFGIASTFRLQGAGSSFATLLPMGDPQSMVRAIDRIQTLEMHHLCVERRTSLRNVMLLSSSLVILLIFAMLCAARGPTRRQAPRGYQRIPSTYDSDQEGGDEDEDGCELAASQIRGRAPTPPMAIPKWAPILAIALIPPICLALCFHALLYAVHYPVEMARIGEFVLEFKYWLSSLRVP